MRSISFLWWGVSILSILRSIRIGFGVFLFLFGSWCTGGFFKVFFGSTKVVELEFGISFELEFHTLIVPVDDLAGDAVDEKVILEGEGLALLEADGDSLGSVGSRGSWASIGCLLPDGDAGKHESSFVLGGESISKLVLIHGVHLHRAEELLLFG